MPNENIANENVIKNGSEGEFSSAPTAPVHSKPAPSAARTASTASTSSTPSATHSVSTASKASPPSTANTASPASTVKSAQGDAGKKTHQLSVSELIKMINAPKPEKPLEKTPVWASVLLITGSVFAAVLFIISFGVAYFYFRGAVGSMILTVLFGICSSLFVLSSTFMICKIEKGIRQIKTRL